MTSSGQKSSSPRIIMLLSGLPPMQMGGAEIQALKLARVLRKSGMDVQVVTWGKIWHPKNGEYEGVNFIRVRSILNLLADVPGLLKRSKKMPAKIVYDDSQEVTTAIHSKVWFGMKLRYTLVYWSWLFYLYFRRSSFDILHVHMMEWPAFVAVRIGKMLKKPVVIKDSTMNGLASMQRYPAGNIKQKEVAGYGRFVAMTRVIRQNLIGAGVHPENITLIPNGIDIIPIPEQQKPWSNKVIFVGNLTQQPAKGIDILLSAWKTVVAEIPGATLRIVGDGDLETYKAYLLQQKLEVSVQLLGKQPDVRSLLNDADVFVLPSRREGMSNALMEAMLCGMPVVATDVSGSQDLIEHGISGYIVPPANVSQLAGALILMLKDPEKAREMGKKAYAALVEKCDITRVAAAYRNLYQKIHESAR